MFFSKSKYCRFWQCPKIAWLDINKPEEKSMDDNALNITQKGNEVGDYAMGLFGDYVEVTTKTEDGKAKVTVMASPNAMEYWAMQYLNYVEIITPIELRERIRTNIENAKKKYK